jgi:three-Cys-motif partner protein
MNPPRQVELHFVEQDPDAVAKLRKVVEDEGKGLTITVDDGDISTYLPTLLEAANGIPLFTYLDPCGLIIPMDEVESIFKRPGGAAATEVLINLTAHLRRFAGMLTSDNPIAPSRRR